MPNDSRKTLRCNLEMNLSHVALLHRYYLKGIAREEFSEQQKREVFALVQHMEDLLTQSGYLTDSEIRLRHDDMQIERWKQIISDPFDNDGSFMGRRVS